MGLFDSVFKLTKDVVEIAVAPVEIVVDMTRIVTKPLADMASEIKEDVKEAADQEEG